MPRMAQLKDKQSIYHVMVQCRVSKLCAMGVEYVHRDKKYEGIIDKLIKGA